jgi:prepilin-type processing-associated H-X9-DG protein
VFCAPAPPPASYGAVIPANVSVATALHTGGINVGMGDGSVRLVAQGISGNTWWYAVTPQGGDILGPDW